MVPQRPLSELTFREKIRDGVQLTRELLDHLERSALPKLSSLQQEVKPRPKSGEEVIPDVTVRTLVAAVLECERFTCEVDDRLEAYGVAIMSEADTILRHSRS